MRSLHARSTLLLASLVLCAAALLAPSSARAQDSAALRAEARAHFQRGMEFFDEGRFDAALAEFQRANDTSPSLEAVYNVGRVYGELGDAVAATRVFERYLSEAGEGIPPARRAEVEQRLARQRSRIAEVWVEARAGGDEPVARVIVSLDGVDLTPPANGAPFLVSAGSHSLGVRAPGYDQAHLALTVAGGDRRHVRTELHRVTRASGTLRVTTSVPAVEIRVDGRPVGRTPLLSTIPVEAGVHHVRATRPGYDAEERTVEVLEDAAVDVAIRLRRADSPGPEEIGRVRVRLPSAPHHVRLDGEMVELGADRGGSLELPVGPHHLSVDVADREPQEQTIEVPAGSTVDLTIRLTWTPDAQADRRGRARRRRLVGRIFSGIGVAFLGVGVGLLAWNEGQIRQTDTAVRELNDVCLSMPAVCLEPEHERRGRALSHDQDRQNVLRSLSITAAGVGAVALAAGVTLWVSARSDEEIDDAASARIDVTPAGARFRLVF